MDQLNRRFSPAAERNGEPIYQVLQRVLPPTGHMLEIGSGTGQHAVYLSSRLPGWTWQPTDVSEQALLSIQAWRRSADAPNVAAPIVLDTTWSEWPVQTASAIFNANTIHIAPFAVCEGLLQGASRILKPGGLLILYGPYRRGGAHTAPSNRAFDVHLQSQDPRWGVRDLEVVVDLAAQAGLVHRETVSMPANNLTVVYQRA